MPPTALLFQRVCRQEFRYLVRKFGFVADSGFSEPFGVRFRGPEFAILVEGTGYGSSLEVFFETGDVSLEYGAELERLGSENAIKEALSLRTFHEVEWRYQLPAWWLFDQRHPGWRSRIEWADQLIQIREYAALLRKCADDLLCGKGGDLTGLFASYREHMRQQYSPDFPDSALNGAIDRFQQVRSAIQFLQSECQVILKVLAKRPEARSLERFVESWRSVVARFGTVAVPLCRGVDVLFKLQNRLQEVGAASELVLAYLVAGEVGQPLTDRVTSLVDLSQGLMVAVEDVLNTLQK